MARPICLFTGQWADLSLEDMAGLAGGMGYDGLELACWGDHFDVQRALRESDYCAKHWKLLQSKGLVSYAISSHLVGQAVADRIDERHQAILSAELWGDGDPSGVRKRAAQEMIDTARAARRFFDCAPDEVKAVLDAGGGHAVVNGFTGSPIWHLLYLFPPPVAGSIEAGFEEFATLWTPILDVFESENVKFALEVHPTEIAFDLASSRDALAALEGHSAFGFNFDPSHFGYQGADYLGFLRAFPDRIYNVHMKDVWWSGQPTEAGVFGGHQSFGSDGRFWDFCSVGRGKIDFEGIMRQLNRAGYSGPLTVEWEDAGMHREHGARESAEYCRKLDFEVSPAAFDAAFSQD